MWRMQVKEVTEYRREVYARVRKVLEESPCIGSRALGWEDPEWAMFMGFEHERIHIETSTVLLREMPLELLQEPMWVRTLHNAYMCAAGSPDPFFVQLERPEQYLLGLLGNTATSPTSDLLWKLGCCGEWWCLCREAGNCVPAVSSCPLQCRIHHCATKVLGSRGHVELRAHVRTRISPLSP